MYFSCGGFVLLDNPFEALCYYKSYNCYCLTFFKSHEIILHIKDNHEHNAQTTTNHSKHKSRRDLNLGPVGSRTNFPTNSP